MPPLLAHRRGALGVVRRLLSRPPGADPVDRRGRPGGPAVRLRGPGHLRRARRRGRLRPAGHRDGVPRTRSSCSAAAPASSCPNATPAALADVVRGVVDHPEHLEQMAAECRRLAPGAVVARRRPPLRRPRRVAARRRRGPDVIVPEPSFEHLAAMSDAHRDVRARRPRRAARRATATAPTTWPGCSSRPAASRSPTTPSSASPGWPTGSSPMPRASTARSATGAPADGRWHGRRGVDDCWGRAMWAFGTAAATGARGRGCAEAAAVVVRPRARSNASHWPRAMAFAALGAAEVLAVAPGPRRRAAPARRRRRRRRAARRRPGVGVAGGSARPTPTPPSPRRSSPPVALLDRPDVLADGLAAAGLAPRPGDGRRAPVADRRPAAPDHGDRAPMFDQQPIEAAAMADACARAPRRDRRRRPGATVSRAASSGSSAPTTSACRIGDFDRGAGFDGLERDGVNLNQGAESTLALITTLQHARALAPARRDDDGPRSSRAARSRLTARPVAGGRPAVRARARARRRAARGGRRASSPTSSDWATPRSTAALDEIARALRRPPPGPRRDVRAPCASASPTASPRTSTCPSSRRLLLGATFTQEFAVEAAAVCNPSAVPDARPERARRRASSASC